MEGDAEWIDVDREFGKVPRRDDAFTSTTIRPRTRPPRPGSPPPMPRRPIPASSVSEATLISSIVVSCFLVIAIILLFWYYSWFKKKLREVLQKMEQMKANNDYKLRVEDVVNIDLADDNNIYANTADLQKLASTISKKIRAPNLEAARNDKLGFCKEGVDDIPTTVSPRLIPPNLKFFSADPQNSTKIVRVAPLPPVTKPVAPNKLVSEPTKPISDNHVAPKQNNLVENVILKLPKVPPLPKMSTAVTSLPQIAENPTFETPPKFSFVTTKPADATLKSPLPKSQANSLLPEILNRVDRPIPPPKAFMSPSSPAANAKPPKPTTKPQKKPSLPFLQIHLSPPTNRRHDSSCSTPGTAESFLLDSRAHDRVSLADVQAHDRVPLADVEPSGMSFTERRRVLEQLMAFETS